jgi:hypothetical protein
MTSFALVPGAFCPTPEQKTAWSGQPYVIRTKEDDHSLF